MSRNTFRIYDMNALIKNLTGYFALPVVGALSTLLQVLVAIRSSDHGHNSHGGTATRLSALRYA